MQPSTASARTEVQGHQDPTPLIPFPLCTGGQSKRQPRVSCSPHYPEMWSEKNIAWDRDPGWGPHLYIFKMLAINSLQNSSDPWRESYVTWPCYFRWFWFWLSASLLTKPCQGRCIKHWSTLTAGAGHAYWRAGVSPLPMASLSQIFNYFLGSWERHMEGARWCWDGTELHC